MKLKSKAASKPGNKLTVFPALRSAQIVIQMANYQITKTDHWQKVEKHPRIDPTRNSHQMKFLGGIAGRRRLHKVDPRKTICDVSTGHEVRSQESGVLAVIGDGKLFRGIFEL